LLIHSASESETPALINPYLRKNLQHTFYYFRLGDGVKKNGKSISLSNKREERYLDLEPGDFAVIKTLEKFALSEQLIGIFGQTSELAKNGIQVLHSPFIDPGYIGELEIGIKNVGPETFNLEYGASRIGKVCFFDISDTYPINIKKTSDFYKRFLESQA
jgi:deoxycytidine triphosphate deaminase